MPPSSPISEQIALITILFIVDVARKCRRSNIKNVFILTRDATTIGTVWKRLQENCEWFRGYFKDFCINDLEISRNSTFLLEIDFSRDIFEQLVVQYKREFGETASLSSFLDFFSVPKALRKHFQEDDYPFRRDWVKMIRNSPAPFKTYLYRTAEERAALVVEYLESRKVIGNGLVAIIDIGYGGTLARILHNCINQSKYKRFQDTTLIHMFLLSSSLRITENAAFTRSSIEVDRTPLLRYKLIPVVLKLNYAWLECFFKDFSKGPLLGYSRDSEGNVNAVFQKPVAPYTCNIDLNREVYKLLNWINPLIFFSTDSSSIIVRNFLRLMAMPDSRTVRALSRFYYVSGHHDQVTHTLIKKIGLSDLFPIRIKKLIYDDYWVSGTFVRSGYSRLLYPLSLAFYIYARLKNTEVSRLLFSRRS